MWEQWSTTGSRKAMFEAPTIPLGEVLSLIYEEFLARYDDKELASLATSTLVNDFLNRKAIVARLPIS